MVSEGRYITKISDPLKSFPSMGEKQECPF